MSDQTPHPDNLKDAVGKLDQSISYVIEVFRGRNATAKLLLIDILLFTILNPLSFTSILKLFGIDKLPPHYSLYFWFTIGIVFAVAVGSAWRKRTKSRAIPAPGERSAVKGLLPYGRDDRAIFARLQRDQDLKECLQAITAIDFRLGVLCGESGTGKTSFLQAALWPTLTQNHHRCLYVKCTELDPVDAIRQAMSDQLAGTQPVKSVPDFAAMLNAAGQLDTSPLVLVLDQFEQFFVHRPHRKDRAAFLAAIEQWYVRPSPFAVKIVFCLRSDFLDRLIELQKLIGYSLGPHQNFRLDKFAPTQAAEIFRVIAEHENLDCDSSFVERMAAEELASLTDGLVSPVDIQILSWMVAAQKADEQRAFDERTFRNLGGVEGLLERFLTRALDARETDQRRQAAVKVLLGLTDLDRNTRAGVLTADELEQKLHKSLPPTEVNECIEWLSRSDVRLIAPVYRKDSNNKVVTGYELAHERLIPALRRVAGQQLSDANRAELLLDRRTNEWLGSGRSSRYLFSWSEIRLITRHRSLIAWGKEQQAKKALLARSQRKLRLRFTAICFAMFLAVFLWFGWNTNQWQIWLLKRDLRTYGDNSSDNRSLYAIAKAFVYVEDTKYVDKLLDEMSFTYGKPEALIALAKVYAALNDKERASAMLQEAIKTDERIRLASPDDSTLKPICEAYVDLATKLNDPQLFGKASETAQLIKDDFERGSTLRDVAHSIREFAEQRRDMAILADGVKVSRLIDDYIYKTDALRDVAESYAHSGNSEQASALLQEASDFVRHYTFSSKVDLLLSKAEAYARVGQRDSMTACLREAVEDELGRRDETYRKAVALSMIANSYVTLQKKESATLLLAEARNLETHKSYEADTLRAIAQVYEKLGNKEGARDLRVESSGLSRRDDSSWRVQALEAIVKGFVRIGAIDQARSALTELVDAERSGPSLHKVDYCAIAECYSQAGDKGTAKWFLSQITKSQQLPRSFVDCNAKLYDRDQLKVMIMEEAKNAKSLISQKDKVRALSGIVESYSQLGVVMKDPLLLADLMPLAITLNEDPKESRALVALTESYIELAETLHDSALLREGINTARLITSDSVKVQMLRTIAGSYVKLNDKVQARAMLSEARKAVELKSDSDESQDAHSLYEIAKLYAEIGANNESRKLLEEVLQTKELSTQDSPNIELLRGMAECYTKIGDTAKARVLLGQAVEAAELVTSDSRKAEELSLLAVSYAKLAEPTNDIALYRDTFRFVERVQDDAARGVVFKAILSSKLAISNVSRVRALTSNFSSEAAKIAALSQLLIAVSHPELIGKEGEDEEEEEY